jgi:predicted dienelactone hydrolase
MDSLTPTEEENKKILGYIPKPFKGDATVDNPTHLDVANLV